MKATDRTQRKIERITAQRDAARRLVCRLLHSEDATISEQGYARMKRWSCYKKRNV